MKTRGETMISFRLRGAINNRLPDVGAYLPGEICLMRLDAIMCLFPDHQQIRTIEHGWTIEVYEEDWEKVEKAFRFAYLGQEIRAK